VQLFKLPRDHRHRLFEGRHGGHNQIGRYFVCFPMPLTFAQSLIGMNQAAGVCRRFASFAKALQRGVR
jgi:hypothetical protein